jgi:hypothetical protein
LNAAKSTFQAPGPVMVPFSALPKRPAKIARPCASRKASTEKAPVLNHRSSVRGPSFGSCPLTASAFSLPYQLVPELQWLL